MPSILDPPPDDVKQEFAALRRDLDDPTHGIPRKELDRNILVATWNIRAFGGLTEKWTASSDDSPKRDLRSLLYISEIVSRFDVVAIQEVKDNLKALRHMLKLLNHPTPHWTLMLTDVNRGDLGNNERLAFVFDTRRVKPSGLACEIVIPDEWLGDEGAYRAQFARTPYAVAFRAEDKTFILVTVHILFGNEDEREDELWAIAEWLADWAEEVNAWDHSLIALGDFNIDGGHMYEIFTRTGLRTPTELELVPRTIFGPSPGKFYDQIAWFVHDGEPFLSLEYTGKGGYFDFTKSVLTDLTNRSLSWRVSDHFPLWVEFSTRDE